MIRKASELLEVFIAEETKKVAGLDMPHMPTLGQAYEEITKQGIDNNFIIPKSLDLNVVSGFVAIDGVMLPNEIDCMLVTGAGEKYGLTEKFIFDINNVLCIFEVKKTLRKSDLADATDHLTNIRKKYSEYLAEKFDEKTFQPKIEKARLRFADITGQSAPENYEGIFYESKSNAHLFHALVIESMAPVTIIHGYDGYKTEYGLRNAYLDLISERFQQKAYGYVLTSIPSLITSNQFCLIKCNGMPYMALTNEHKWALVSSTRYNSALVILEMLWSKISYYFDVRLPYNDDLYLENIQPLLCAEYGEYEGKAAWIFEPIELQKKALEREDNSVWHPAKIGQAEMSAIHIMFARGGYLPLDEEMVSWIYEKHGVSLESIIENLVDTILFMREGKFIRPINDCTYVLDDENGGGYVAKEQERFDLWCNENGLSPHYLVHMFVDDD